MKRRRFLRADTKVWHDPMMSSRPRRGPGTVAALEEATSGPAGGGPARSRAMPLKRTGARIIAGPLPERDPRELERERLLARMLGAEGRPSITATVDAYLAGGFELPDQQAVWLQLLEHNNEERVADAIGNLARLLDEQAPERRAVLESRLRRIEELADEASTQEAAAELRRVIAAKHAATLT
jgi:hypothetical protein